MGNVPTVSSQVIFDYIYNPRAEEGFIRAIESWPGSIRMWDSLTVKVEVPKTFGSTDRLYRLPQSTPSGVANIYWLTADFEVFLGTTWLVFGFVSTKTGGRVAFNEVAKSIQSSLSMKVLVTSTPPTTALPKQITTFGFNSVESKDLPSLGSTVNQGGSIVYGDKPVEPSDTMISELRIQKMSDLSNDTGYYRTDINLVRPAALAEGGIELTYDASLCPNITSITLNNGTIVITSNVPVTKLLSHQNINESTLDIPGTLQFDIAFGFDGHTAYLTPHGGNLNDLMKQGSHINFSLLIVPPHLP